MPNKYSSGRIYTMIYFFGDISSCLTDAGRCAGGRRMHCTDMEKLIHKLFDLGIGAPPPGGCPPLERLRRVALKRHSNLESDTPGCVWLKNRSHPPATLRTCHSNERDYDRAFGVKSSRTSYHHKSFPAQS